MHHKIHSDYTRAVPKYLKNFFCWQEKPAYIFTNYLFIQYNQYDTYCTVDSRMEWSLNHGFGQAEIQELP